MAKSITFLSEMKSGRYASTVEVRLLPFWETQKVKRGGEFMGVDFGFLVSHEGEAKEGDDNLKEEQFREMLSDVDIYGNKGITFDDFYL